MIFNTGAALLDTIVLSVVSKEIDGTYGYKITQDVRNALDVSDQLFIQFKRLLKDNCLETYDQEYQGRNRRYYKITPQGQAQLQMYRQEWTIYVQKINRIIEEGK